MPIRAIANEYGVSLLSAFVGMGIVMVSIWGFMQINSGLKVQDVRMNRRVQGEALLASVGVELQRKNFTELEEACALRGAFAAAGAAALCTNAEGTQLTENIYDPAESRDRLGRRIDLRPGNLAAGSTCVELKRCRWRADGHLLEVGLLASWTVPPGTKIAQRDLLLRKVR